MEVKNIIILPRDYEPISRIYAIREWLKENYPDYEKWASEPSRTIHLFVAIPAEGNGPERKILGVSIELHGSGGHNEQVAVLVDKELEKETAKEVRRMLGQNYVDTSEDTG